MWIEAKRFLTKLFFKEKRLMFGKNKHIADFLDYYLLTETDVNYAVLINGEWGTGKTWFINEYIPTIRKEAIQVVKVSLYGLKTVEDIDIEIFKLVNPSMNNVKNGLMGKLISSASKSSVMGFKFDLSDFLPSGKYAFKDNKEYVLIFDDLERSHITNDLLFGHINQFVEILGIKIVLIGSEEKLIAKDKHDNDSIEFSYKNIKEKLIGKTFKYLSESDVAIEYFIQRSSCSTTFKNTFGLINDVFNRANYGNLRELKAALDDFCRLYKFSFKDKGYSDDFLQDVLKFFLIFHIEDKHYNENNEFFLFRLKGWSYFFDDDDKDNEKHAWAKEISKKYDVNFYSGNYVFSDKTWENMISFNIIKNDEVEDEISLYLNHNNTPDWLRLWNWSDLKDKSFLVIFEEIVSKINSFSYDCLGEVVHLYSIMYFLEESNVITLEKISHDFNIYLNHMRQKGLLDYSSLSSLDGSYSGYGFMKSEKLSKIYDSLNSCKLQLLNELVDVYVNRIENNYLEIPFVEIFNNPVFNAYSTAFLHKVDPDKFVEITINNEYSKISHYYDFIKDRYRSPEASLLAESDFIEKCLLIYDRELISNSRTITKLNCKRFVGVFNKSKNALERLKNRFDNNGCVE